jgi:4-hydroxybenzoyl-CoA thioesterase
MDARTLHIFSPFDTSRLFTPSQSCGKKQQSEIGDASHMVAYKHINDVGLAHCDPSGIVFLPRYYEMIHIVVENWFDEALDWPMGQMQGNDRAGLPFVNVETSFPSPSRLGDRLTWRLNVLDIGRSSMKLSITAQCGIDTRVRCTASVVLSDLGVLHARRWPDQIRARAEEFLGEPGMREAIAPSRACSGPR